MARKKTKCGVCGGSGVLSGGSDFLGIPNGWTQRCDACEVYADDLEAFNAHRRNLGMFAMDGYPFSLVERADATPERPIRQTLFVRLGDHEAAVTVVAEGDDLGLYELAESVRYLTVDNLRGQGVESIVPFPDHEDFTIYDCLPAEFVP